MLFGSVPFNTLEANIDYSHIMQKTRNGTWGFQTWLHFKKRKRGAPIGA
jgi:ribosomal protein S3